MRKILRIAALLLALAVLGTWLALGPNAGFTKTSVPHIRKDPVTDLEVQDYEKKFVPGIDFVGLGLAVAMAVAGSSFLVPKVRKGNTNERNAGK